MINFDFLIGDPLITSACEGLLLMCVLFSYYKIRYNPKNGENNFVLLVILMLCYSLLYSPEGGDSYITFKTYRLFQLGVDQSQLHLESVYFFLMSIFSSNYVFWRISVWGVALILYVSLMKHFKCNANVSLFVWSVLGLQAFYYQRISLAIAMMFYGIVLFEEYRSTKRNFMNLSFSIVLFISSLLFHRSMPIYIVISILILLLPNKRWSILLALLFMPVFLFILLNFIPDILSTTSDDFQSWGEGYLDASKVKGTANLNGMLFEFIRWAPFTIMMIFCLYKYLKMPHSFSIYEKYFLLFAVVLYCLYFLLQGHVAYAFAGKMKMQSILAMSMFLVIYLKDRLYLKSSKRYIFFSFLVFLTIQVYSIVYSIF